METTDLPDVEKMNEAERLTYITLIRSRCQSGDAADDEIKNALKAVRVQRGGAGASGKKAAKPEAKKVSMAELLGKTV